MARENNSPPLRAPLLTAIESYEKWFKEKQDAAEKASQPSQPLYHYTSAAGLKGIIDSGEFRLSHVSQLNDTSEYKFGFDIAIKELATHAEVHKNQYIRKFCMRAIEKLRYLRRERVFEYFVGCFSTKGNDLGQWRSYGDNGRGFALGLAPTLFHTTSVTPVAVNERVFVAQVEYGEEKTRVLQAAAIDHALNIIEQTLRDPSIEEFINQDEIQLDYFLDHMAIEMSPPILWYSLTCKDGAYESESEVRLLMIHGKGNEQKIETRIRKSEFVSFVRYPLHLGQISNIAQIVVGPAASEISKSGIRHFVQSLGLNPDNVLKPSLIPYRVI